ncbi:hypothetical protein DYI23_05910 [Roseibium polysiphoniae]|uniref:Uncharacterized protein n=2 Tax=Roseibium polysiphoniae TaxID=2571221 RepID=A0A944GS15_9HYPH|nr:hypothetical protein [Roseibium polysiphoniae]
MRLKVDLKGGFKASDHKCDSLLAALHAAYPDGPPVASMKDIFEPVGKRPELVSPQLHILKLLVFGRAWADGHVLDDGKVDAKEVARSAYVWPDQIETLFDHRPPGADGMRKLLAYVDVTAADLEARAFRLALQDASVAQAFQVEEDRKANLPADVSDQVERLCPVAGGAA